ncbi:DUF6082 family protein [Paractinoplanes lichenicola]|uniref:Phage abortive infection protein n=1 Tax=Paractinoplanes lichenicola TaxID=2802976 RepID=A0ABS1VN08_9ACTN|nr:DUF6082 family protein [Actinoplanes lichenicola]MBL7255600.1 hypothetical protein [Actinoplanes lichenicola]
MAADKNDAFHAPARKRTGSWGLLWIAAALAVIGVALSPLLLGLAYSRAGVDFGVIGDVGQAYGAASALVATTALVAVAASLIEQRRQVREVRLQLLDQTTDELVRLAMANPVYRQCWGARVSPGHVAEDLFYYCQLLVKLWTDSWEQRKIDEPLARAYLQSFFDSEVPRMFWERTGDWHCPGPARNHRDQFRVLVNEEYLRALRAGPPARSFEQFPSTDDSFPVINKPRTSRPLEFP